MTSPSTSSGFPCKVFNVTVHEDRWRDRRRPWRRHVCWRAESNDAPGWHVAADTEEELTPLIMEGLQFWLNDDRSAIAVLTKKAA